MNTAQNPGDRERHRIQTAFVDVLERTRLVRAPASRELLIEELRDRLGSFPLREYAQLRLQVVELVRGCARLPDGVAILLDTVEHLEPATTEGTQLRRLQDEWEAVDVLTADDWGSLRQALENLQPPNLTVLCQRATEHRLAGSPPWCDTAWHAFVYLAGQNAGPDGLAPSMAFLALLEDQVDAQAARLIHGRNRRLASAQELTAQLEERRVRLREGADQPMDSTAYLVIQVEPHLKPENSADSEGPEASEDVEDPADAYIVSSFRQWYGADSWHSRRGDSKVVRQGELEREVERVIDEMEVEWSDRTGTVVVEFVLPWELLNADVAWWRKEIDSSRPTPLAMDYPVVIRSLERLRTPRWHRPWYQRWQQLRTAPAGSAAHWSHPGGDDYFTRLETELKSDTRVVSLVLSEPPTQPDQTGQQEVMAALRAGLPVIIWHRQDCTSAAFRETVMGLISDGGLAQLPNRIGELRHDALKQDPALRIGHIGRHLTVLWDDPERRPDPLRAPPRSQS